MKNATAGKPPNLTPAPEADGAEPHFLKTLGARVRDARARHGMTRRMLAHDSGISERYLAEMESGRGNFSIMLLKKLAKAIDVPLNELVDDQPVSPVYMLLVQRLRGLGARELDAASSMIAERFGRRRDRRDRIALIGLRGAGKSTLGPLLAKQLNYEFVELSNEIATATGARIDEVFELGGQAAYRRHELNALRRLVARRAGLVIAVGGGLVSEATTFQCLLDSCYTVWLRAAPHEHWERVMRQGDYRVREGTAPAAALADMRRILAQREGLYRMADAALDTGGKTIRQAARELIALVGQRAPQEARRVDAG